MSQDSRASQPTSFLDALHPAADDADLGWAPRRGPRAATTTSAAFGAVEVGPPVSRMTAPEPAAQVEPAEPAPPAVAAPQRCPSCGSRTRPEEAWCSLCHTSLRPAPEPPAVPAAVPVAVPASASPVSRVARLVEDDDGQLALDLDTPAGAATSTPDRPALDEAEVDRMLGALSRQSGTGVRGLGSRRAKVLVAAGGAAGLTALLLAGTAVLGSVLG